MALTHNLNNWNTFTHVFADSFPGFKGKGLLAKVSEYYQWSKGAENIVFDRYGITADGEYRGVIPHPTDLPMPVFPDDNQQRTRPPTAYNLYVTSHRDRMSYNEVGVAMRRWKYLNDGTKRRYQAIVDADIWRAFYNFMHITKERGLTPFQHLAEFEELPPATKRSLNQ